MKILIDTSVWIEYFRGNDAVFAVLFDHIEAGRVYALGCVFAELLQGARSQKEAKLLQDYFENLPKLPENSDLWLNAGKYAFEHKLTAKGVGIIDVAQIVAAKRHGLKMWTLDKKLLRVLGEEDIFEFTK